MRIYLDMIGCRLNQSEVEHLANLFRALGHTVVDDPSDADLVIVNTCAVTVKAAADSRKHIRRAARAGADQIVVTGCWSTLYPEKALSLPGVSRVFSNREKERIVPELLDVPSDVIEGLKLVRESLPGDRARTRAFIKVGDGCDNHCTYCLTRLARGALRSRPVDEILEAVHVALRGGAKEVVLTGVQLGGWGRDLSPSRSLKDLIAAVLSISSLGRLRLSSIEPWDFDFGMLDLWDDDRLCRHLHIPLQSGCDRLLAAMGRPITRNEYGALISGIRRRMPDMALTTDVITGFPGETAADFETALAFIRQLRFSGGHVFTYSPRPGTAAYKMKDAVTREVAKARNARLRQVFADLAYAYRSQYLAKILRVLWESARQNKDGRWTLSGLTDNYLRVAAGSDQKRWNAFSDVRITENLSDRPVLLGEIVKKSC
jgi:threonylcarbamoyladenosine tRNA methylthiotransferase MtaB